ncbi:alcohol acetyltransferase [Xylariaceae sp. FL0662B]|nr:alcohol acetyltransferase [Xylariaceae sp. FL0662B]
MHTQQNEKSTVIRALGPLETFISAHHLLRTAYRTIVTGRYAVPAHSSPQALARILERAVALTILEHPLLAVGQADEDSKQPSWVRLKQIDLGDMIIWAQAPGSEDYAQFLGQILMQHHDTPFTDLDTVPGWRMTVLRPSDIPTQYIDVVFQYNHANVDGISGKIFHQTLHRNLDLVSGENKEALWGLNMDGHVLHLPQNLRLTPTQEELLKFPISPSFIVGTAWKGLRPSYFVPAEFARWAPIQASPNETSLQLFTTDAADMKHLLSACRSNRTTITGLLHALTLISLSRRLPNQPGFVGSSTINMRRFIEDDTLDPDHMMGNFVTLMTHLFDSKFVSELRVHTRGSGDSIAGLQDLVWEVAAKIRAELVQKLERGTADDMMGLVGLMAKGDFRSILKGEMKKHRECSWEVSNLGTMDVATAEDTEWSVERLISSQSAVANGAAILIFPISVKGGCMCTTITAQKAVVKPALAEALATDLAAWLEVLAKDASMY